MSLRRLPETVLALPGVMDAPSRSLSLSLILVLSLIVAGGATDLWLDGPEKWFTVHAALEILLLLCSSAGLIFFWRSWRESEREARAIRIALTQSQESLAERRAERDRLRADAEHALAGLGKAIDAQFDSWSLTPTEREVAVLLLKGLGHKQIAGQTGRSERTVRQHAVSVYGKAGLSGRAELAAFFLQDLMLPSR